MSDVKLGKMVDLMEGLDLRARSLSQYASAVSYENHDGGLTDGRVSEVVSDFYRLTNEISELSKSLNQEWTRITPAISGK